MVKLSEIFIRTLLYKGDPKDGNYDFEQSKSLAIILESLLKRCGEKHSDFDLESKLEYKQDDKDPSILAPTFKFDIINQNNLNILLEELSMEQPSNYSGMLLQIVNVLRKRMKGELPNFP